MSLLAWLDFGPWGPPICALVLVCMAAVAVVGAVGVLLKAAVMVGQVVARAKGVWGN